MIKPKNSHSEEICRCFFEQIFGYKFIQIRPDWFRSDKNCKMELDGYCAELNLAFEHNGRFHYEAEANKGIERVQFLDKLKIELCKKIGIKLIVIPELFKQVKFEDLKKFIKNECEKLNVKIPSNFEYINISLSNLDQNSYFDLVKLKVKEKGGRVLSKIYINSTSKIQVLCNNNHIWDVTPIQIMQGYWCEECHHISKLKYDINFLNNYNKNIRCLSPLYKGLSIKLKWECLVCLHTWDTTPKIILADKGCPKCGKKKWLEKVRFSESDILEIIKTFNIICENIEDYKNSNTVLNWKCNDCNYIWKQSFHDVKVRMEKRSYICIECKNQ